MNAYDGTEFSSAYRSYIQNLLARQNPTYRVPELQAVAPRRESALYDAMLDSVLRLHERHSWPFADTGKRVSFGLVRVANIRTAIQAARYLADRLPDQGRIACYHANDFPIQRHHKEMRLDFLLTRDHDQGNAHIEQDPATAALVRAAPGDVIFVVVATPVEEVGRDHDFDWGVIEPSGTHSIVQTAGRINRHRRQIMTTPNIAILQFNARYLRNQKPVFCRPGLEGERAHCYSEHDLGTLLNWSKLERLDAGLRFGDHPFAKQDDRILAGRLRVPMNALRADKESSAWMANGFYGKYALRDHQAVDLWRACYDDDTKEMKFYLFQGNSRLQATEAAELWKLLRINRRPPVSNHWLTLDDKALVQSCQELGLTLEEGLTFTVPQHDHRKDGPEQLVWDRSFGFVMNTTG